MHITIRPVENTQMWDEARRIRHHVFVEEQGCPPEEEWDAHDEVARHFVLYADGEAVGAARWRTALYRQKPVAKLERFSILPAFRGHGLGRALVATLMADAARAGFEVQVLHAQAHLEGFYRSFGFERAGEDFLEAGIVHVPMVRHGGKGPEKPPHAG